MATIAKRDGKYRVQVRRQGQGSISKTFTTKKDAERWARDTEIAIEAGRYQPPQAIASDDVMDRTQVTLQTLIERYRDSVTARKRGVKNESWILNAFIRDAPMARKKLADVTPSDWARYRDTRLKDIKPNSLKRQLCVYQHMYEVAMAEWGLKLEGGNPLANVSLDYVDQRRDRRLKEGELERIITEAKRRRNSVVLQCILWAKETGMRRGEILALRWDDIDMKARVLFIPMSKNGRSRQLPITKAMMEILEGQDVDSSAVFPIKDNNLKLTWKRILKAVGIADLHFHDLRHEAISTLFEKGLAIQEVASISGHQSWKMLQRYTHPKPADILKKLELAC